MSSMSSDPNQLATLTPLADASGFNFVIEGVEPVKWSENLASRPIRLKAQGFP